MFRTQGAPRDAGIDQGRALRHLIRRAAAANRARNGRARFRRARRSAALQLGVPLLRFLPQHHERLQGIASGAGLSLAALEVLDSVPAVSVGATAKGSELEASFRTPDLAAWPLLLRSSDPDVGGFPSVELTAAPWASSVAGVNAHGLAALCVDARPGGVSTRVLVQELLLRSRDFTAALDHLRRRAPYAGVYGTLLLAAPGHDPARIRISPGGVAVDAAPDGAPAVGLPRLRIDAATRTLVWTGPDGSEQIAEPGPMDEVVR